MRFPRVNPTLLILSNPSTIPDEAKARKSWEKFHLKKGSQAGVIKIPDIKGLPKTVVVLGAFEGLEWLPKPESDKYDVIEWNWDEKRGPWLVSDPDLTRLWIVSTNEAGLRGIPSSGYVRAICYFPQKASGKRAQVGYRHCFGDADSTKHEDGDEECYPRIVGKGRSREFVEGKFTIDSHGIVR